MKRLAIVACLAAVVLPAPSALAACQAPPGRSTADGRNRIRHYAVIALGFVNAKRGAPSDAHGVYSFYFTVKRYYTGNGPAEIEITNYGDFDLPPGYDKPGSAKANSRDFVRRQGGNPAVFFLVPHDTALGKQQTRYADEYATNSCQYNAIGQGNVDAFVPLLNDIFSRPPNQPEISSPPPGVLPTQSTVAAASASKRSSSGRGGPIVRAGLLAVVVAAALGLFTHPRSPLFDRSRSDGR